MLLPDLRIAGSLDDLPWRATRYEGVEWIDLANDETSSSMTVLIRMAPGRGYPRHRHVGAEDVLVLDGGYVDDDGGRYEAGAFVRYEAGSAHAPTALDGNGRACVLFAVAHGGTEVVGDDPEGTR